MLKKIRCVEKKNSPDLHFHNFIWFGTERLTIEDRPDEPFYNLYNFLASRSGDLQIVCKSICRELKYQGYYYCMFYLTDMFGAVVVKFLCRVNVKGTGRVASFETVAWDST